MNSRCRRFIKRLFVFLLICPIHWSLSHASLVNATQLKQQVEYEILQQWQSLEQRKDATSKVLVSGIPQGYRVPPCPQALRVKANKQLVLGRNSIQVSCIHKTSWSLMLTAEIEVWRDVVVLRDHITRGDAVNSTYLTLQQRNIGKLQRGYFTRLDKVTGNISKRSLKAGTAISPSMISLPIIVQRGQAITLRVERPGIAVDMKGLALKKGRQGDTIKVKNSSSNKVLFGTIVDADLVLVN